MKMTDKLDLLLAEKKITRGKLAELTGVPYTTIVGYYDRGYENAKLKNLWQLANFFGCTLDSLTDDDVELAFTQNEDEETKKAPHQINDEELARLLENPALRKLCDNLQKMSEDDLKAALNYSDFLLQKKENL